MKIDKVTISPTYFERGKLPPREVTVLKQDNGLVWMSDCPQERVFMGAAARLVKPGMTVLTAGLGLGVFPRMALDRGASKVLVIEKDREIVQTVGPTFGKDWHEGNRLVIINMDVAEYMREAPRHLGDKKWDLAYIDIWGGEPVDLTLLDRYRLKNLASKIAKHVTIWALARQERNMREEIAQTIESVNSPEVVARGLSHAELSLRMSHRGFFLPSLFLADPEKRYRMSSVRFFKHIKSDPVTARKQAIALFTEANEAALDQWKNELMEKMLEKYVETGEMPMHVMDAVASLHKLPDEEDSNGQA